MEKTFLELVKKNIGYNVKGTIRARFETNGNLIIIVITDRIYGWSKKGVRQNINTTLPHDIAKLFKKDYERYIISQYFTPTKTNKTQI